MATKVTVAAEINVNSSQGEAAVTSFKKQLRDATAELVAINEKFGATSQEAINAAKRVAGLKDAIGDAKDLAASFNPDAKFKSLSSALSAAAGGFAAVQGAQALFGAQSEDLEKTLVKVQGALALSQGLEQLGGLGDAFKNLKATAIDAFNGIKSAIGSTGIGLLVIALGAIYTYWDDIKEAVSGVSAEQLKQNELLKASVKSEQEKLTFIERNEATLRLQGKSENEILQLKIAAVKGEIEKQKQLILSNKLIQDQRVAAAQQNYEILKGFLDFISIPQRKIFEIFSTTINKIIEVANKIPGIDIKFKINGQLAEDATDFLAKKVFNVEEIKKQGDASNKEAQQQLETLTNKQSGYQLQVNQINKDASAKNAKDAEQAQKDKEAELAKALEAEKQRNAILEEIRLNGIKDEFTKKQMILARQEQKELDDLTEAFNKKLISEDEYKLGKENLTKIYDAKELELIKQKNDEQAKLDKEKKDKKDKDDKEAADKEIQLAKDVADAKKAVQDATLNAIGAGINFLQAIAGKNKGLQKAAAIAEGAFGIAKIVINTNAANSAALLKYSLIPGGQALSAAEITANKIGAALGIASTVAATAKAIQAIGGGGSVPSPSNVAGGGGNNGGINAPLTPQTQTTRLDQAQVNQIGNAAARAYVLESDVTNNQERITRLNRAARIN